MFLGVLAVFFSVYSLVDALKHTLSLRRRRRLFAAAAAIDALKHDLSLRRRRRRRRRREHALRLLKFLRHSST